MSEEPVVDDRPPARPQPRWGLGEAVAGYLVAFTLGNLVAGIWYEVGGEKETLVSVATTLVASWVGLAGAAVLASRLKGTGSLREDFGLRVHRRDVLPGLAFGVASHVLVLMLYLPFRLLNPDLDLSEEARRVTDLGRGPGLVLLAVVLVVGAPVVEELFFRGLLQRSLERRFGPGWAVAGSALAFGVTHYQPLQLLGLVAFGVVLGVLTWRSGRLGPAVVAHATFNAATVAVLVAAR